MDRINKVIRNNNAAKNFSSIGRSLQEKAEKEGIPFTQAIDEFIASLNNINNIDDNIAIDTVTLTGFDEKLIKDLIEYMKSVRKRYKQMESNEEKRKKREAKKEYNEAETKRLDDLYSQIIEELSLIGDKESDIEKLNGILQDINSGSYELDTNGKKYLTKKLQSLKEQTNENIKAKLEQECKEEIRRAELDAKITKSWEEIQEIAKGKGTKNPVECWIAIRENLNSKEQDNSEDGEYVKSKLLQLVDGQINAEKDEEYFKQVEYFTRGFRFLRGSPEVMNAIAGRSIRKFTNEEAYYRFCELRTSIQGNNSESKQIEVLLRRKDISDVDRRILEARQTVIREEFQKQQEAR